MGLVWCADSTFELRALSSSEAWLAHSAFVVFSRAGIRQASLTRIFRCNICSGVRLDGGFSSTVCGPPFLFGARSMYSEAWSRLGPRFYGLGHLGSLAFLLRRTVSVCDRTHHVLSFLHPPRANSARL